MRNDEQHKEEIIELLTTISEIIWDGGLLMLDMMHRGNLDNLLSENDKEYKQKNELLKKHKDLLAGDLFGELTFIVITQTIEKNIERLIGLLSANEDDWPVCFHRENFLNLSKRGRKIY